MIEPKLRTVNKAKAPFSVNRFPNEFVKTLSQNIVYMMATKQSMSLEGSEWEQIFAECVGAEWKPSNVGLDDIVLDSCCWGAKTVFGQGDLSQQSRVRLICGRNAVTYSYGIDNYSELDPNKLGKMVLEIWNERVSAVRKTYKFVRTVVLVKSKDFSDYLVFEFETIRYDPELYYFMWNKRGNLEGYNKSTKEHKFTWQPSGSQFTIIEDIPKTRLHISIKKPSPINKETILKTLNFDETWYNIVSSERPEPTIEAKTKNRLQTYSQAVKTCDSKEEL